MSEDDMEQARKAHEREAYNPYSREKMGAYLNRLMGEKAGIESDALPLESKRDLLCSLSAVAYGRENGFWTATWRRTGCCCAGLRSSGRTGQGMKNNNSDDVNCCGEGDITEDHG